MGVRIFAVGVLVSGIGVGHTAGYLTKTGDTRNVRDRAAAQEHKGQETHELPPPNTNDPQPLQAGARTTQVKAQLAAEAKAKAIAKAKAEAAARAAKARADAAAKDRASRAATRSAGGATGSTGGGEAPPPVPVDCKSKSGNRQLGCSLMVKAGIKSNEFTCLDNLWTRESGWNPNAHNRSSGAHGIPQALPASKMKPYGANYLTDPTPQILWGLDYIKGRYDNSPCEAWGHSERTGWY